MSSNSVVWWHEIIGNQFYLCLCDQFGLYDAGKGYDEPSDGVTLRLRHVYIKIQLKILKSLLKNMK